MIIFGGGGTEPFPFLLRIDQGFDFYAGFGPQTGDWSDVTLTFEFDNEPDTVWTATYDDTTKIFTFNEPAPTIAEGTPLEFIVARGAQRKLWGRGVVIYG